MEEYCTITGKDIGKEELTIPKAIEAFGAVSNSKFCHFEKLIVTENGNEIIVFITEAEIPQYPANDIKNKEKIAVEFYKSDNFIPKVYALRKSFPSLPHINLEVNEFPRSLCLYD